MKVGELIAYLKLDSSQFKEEVKNTTATSEKMGGGFKNLAGDAAMLAGGITAVAGASYMLSQKFGGIADELEDLSYQTGISTKDIQQLQYAAALSGDSFASVATAINRLTISMQEFKDPASAAAKAFAAIGVNPSGKSTKQVFDETAIALTNMADETERNAAAMDIYGRNYKELLPFMEDYIKNANIIKDSPVYSEKDIKDLKDAKTAWDSLSASLTIYSGKFIAFLQNVQGKVNQLNPILNLYKTMRGYTPEIDPAINTLITEDQITNTLRDQEKIREDILDTTTLTGWRLQEQLDFQAKIAAAAAAQGSGGTATVSLRGATGTTTATADVSTSSGAAADSWWQDYGSVDPKSAVQTTEDNSMQIRGTANTLARRVQRMAQMLKGMNVSPAVAVKLSSYFTQAGPANINGLMGAEMSNFSLEQYERAFQPEFNRLTRGTNPQYDANGRMIVYVQVDGKTIAEAVVENLRRLGADI